MESDSPKDSTSHTELKRSFYSRFNLDEFRSKIADFWSQDFSDDADAILARARQTVSVGDDFVFPFSWDEYLPGSDFWRIRKIPSEHFREGLNEPDLWEAPSRHAPAGRLNSRGESLLYSCLGNPIGPLYEAGLVPGDTFIFIWYKLIRPIMFKRVGITNPDPDLTDHEQQIEEALSAFLRDVLAIPAKGQELRSYTLTQKVLQTYYHLAPQESGWTYTSTFKAEVLNAAIEPKAAHARLAINTVIAGQVVAQDMNGEFTINCRAYSDGKARHGDKIGFEFFPEDGLQSLQDIFEWAHQNR